MQSTTELSRKMNYSSRAAAFQRAREITSSAISTKRRGSRLLRCRALLRELDPNHPPARVHPREFSWQYRALRERVHVFSEKLSSVNEKEPVADQQLYRAEAAIELSLNFFHDALTPAGTPDDENVDGENDPN